MPLCQMCSFMSKAQRRALASASGKGSPILPVDAELVLGFGDASMVGEHVVGQGRGPAPSLEQKLVEALAQLVPPLDPSLQAEDEPGLAMSAVGGFTFTSSS